MSEVERDESYHVAAPVSPKLNKGSNQKTGVLLSSWPTPLCSLSYTIQRNGEEVASSTAGLFVVLDAGEKAVKQALPENPLKVAKSLLGLITKARRGYRNQQGQNEGFRPRNNNLDI